MNAVLEPNNKFIKETIDAYPTFIEMLRTLKLIELCKYIVDKYYSNKSQAYEYAIEGLRIYLRSHWSRDHNPVSKQHTDKHDTEATMYIVGYISYKLDNSEKYKNLVETYYQCSDDYEKIQVLDRERIDALVSLLQEMKNTTPTGV